MRLEYLLQGLNYPCTIEWYFGEIEDESCVGCRKYTFSKIEDVINAHETTTIVKEFKRIDSAFYKIAIV